jgi:integrase/recombinase XerD
MFGNIIRRNKSVHFDGKRGINMKQAKVLTEIELKRLLKIVAFTRHAERNRLIVMLSFLSGLRACEIAQMRVKDVISATADIKDEIYFEKWQTKGRNAQSVVISELLQKEIAQYIKAFPHLLADNEGRLLRSQKQNDFSSQSIQNLFRGLYKLANIDNASSHSGRRTFITNLSEKGVSVRVIQELARHSSMATTQRYIDVSVDKLRNAVELVGL